MLIAIQDVARRIFVAVQLRPTIGAGVPSDREIFGDQGAAAATCLGGIAWGDFDDGAASFFRFACAQSREGSPGSIKNTLVQATFRGSPIWQKLLGLFILLGFGRGTHVLDLKIFKDECAIGVDQAARGFMQEVLATVSCLAVQPGQLALGSVSSVTATCATREFLVSLFDLLFGGAIDAGVVDDDAIGEDCVPLEAEVDTDLLAGWMKSHRRIEWVLDTETGVPVVAIPFDRAGFDRSHNGTMHDHLDMAYFGERELARFLLVLLQGLGHPDDIIALLRKREAVIPARGFVARIARNLAVFDAAKEVLHRFVETVKHLLQDLRIDLLVFGPLLFDIGQLVGLHLVGDGDPTHAVGFASLFERRIIYLFTSAQDPFQRCDLLAGGVEPVLVHLVAQRGIFGSTRRAWLAWLLFVRHGGVLLSGFVQDDNEQRVRERVYSSRTERSIASLSCTTSPTCIRRSYQREPLSPRLAQRGVLRAI
jgi:hypothetical protein